MMEDASPTEAHSSRRTAAAMAAQASAMVPINSKSRKRSEGATKSAKQAKATQERRGSTSTNSSGQAKVSKAPATQPPPLVDEHGRLPILQCHQTTDADEAYGDQERALSEFLKLHPMLSVTHTTLEQHTATVVVLRSNISNP